MSISFSTPPKLQSELGSLAPEVAELRMPCAESLTQSEPLASADNALEVKDTGALLLLKDIDQAVVGDEHGAVPAELLAISREDTGNTGDVAEQWVNYILAAWH